jgi:hypothetical protein
VVFSEKTSRVMFWYIVHFVKRIILIIIKNINYLQHTDDVRYTYVIYVCVLDALCVQIVGFLIIRCRAMVSSPQ